MYTCMLIHMGQATTKAIRSPKGTIKAARIAGLAAAFGEMIY